VFCEVKAFCSGEVPRICSSAAIVAALERVGKEVSGL
jgi:hypothetical protein